MNIKIERNGVNTMVYIEGKVDTLLADEMKCTFDTQIGEGSHVVIDGSSLEYITSAALRVFLSLFKRMKASGGSLEFMNVKSTVMQVFKLTGFDTFVKFK